MMENQLAFYSRRIREVKNHRKLAKARGDTQEVERYTTDLVNYIRMRKQYKERKPR